MNDRRSFLQGAAVLAAAAALPTTLWAAEERYVTLSQPVSPENDEGKIEVLEFFHYGCPHCRSFHPLIETWKKSLPDDVLFRAVPAIWNNPSLLGLARLHYALERSGELNVQVEREIFAAVQEDKRDIFDAENARAWLATVNGVDVDAVMETYDSFAIQGLLKRADQLARTYRVQGVPTMAVGGRYTTSASLAGGHEATLEVVDSLIERIRNEG
ncbi:MAG TPA: thiol:disulfide interchange protein DsbA/DsbL [Azoarcus sp.]|nr:thiol:disulfide interchange protein DsbA/DsbL [Azoarcus sp.]